MDCKECGRPRERRVIQAAAKGLRWMIGQVDTANGLRIEGWALSSAPERARFLLNGGEFEIVQYPIPAPALAETFWTEVPESCARFACQTTKGMFVDGLATMEFQPVGEETAETLAKRMYFYDPELEAPMPAGDNLWRVIGTQRAVLYALTGATTIHRLDHYLRAQFDRPISSFKRILDWGCGAARQTRYLTRFFGPSITGIDIDRVNIRWDRENITGARFERVSVTPPTMLTESSFDLVIGTSVLTHLREDDQFRWLAELQRVTAPGALLFLTFVGDTVLGLKHYKEERIAEIDKAGFLFGSTNRSVQSGVDLEEEEFYVNVFHTKEYVRREWGRYFEVLAIEPSLLELQDVAVLRRSRLSGAELPGL